MLSNIFLVDSISKADIPSGIRHVEWPIPLHDNSPLLRSWERNGRLISCLGHGSERLIAKINAQYGLHLEPHKYQSRPPITTDIKMIGIRITHNGEVDLHVHEFEHAGTSKYHA